MRVQVCAFVPANIPICAGMLMTAPTTFNVIFWQWVNQSYNAGFNYSNRNANSSLTTERLGGIYLTATTISCGIALGLGKAVKRAPVGAGTAALLAKVVPFVAVGSSNVFNLVAMRRYASFGPARTTVPPAWRGSEFSACYSTHGTGSGELATGIPVTDKDGKALGTSKAAARSAVAQAAITRALLPAPVLLLPPIIMKAFGNLSPRARSAAELAVRRLPASSLGGRCCSRCACGTGFSVPPTRHLSRRVGADTSGPIASLNGRVRTCSGHRQLCVGSAAAGHRPLSARGDAAYFQDGKGVSGPIFCFLPHTRILPLSSTVDRVSVLLRCPAICDCLSLNVSISLCALTPQQCAQGLTTARGEPVTDVYFNRGV